MLAGRSKWTARRRGYPFFLKRGCGVLVYGRFLMQPKSMSIDVPPFTRFFPICISCCIRLSSAQQNHMYSSKVTRTKFRAQGRGYPQTTSCNPRGNDRLGQQVTRSAHLDVRGMLGGQGSEGEGLERPVKGRGDEGGKESRCPYFPRRSIHQR